jgi:hypothetical protein
VSGSASAGSVPRHDAEGDNRHIGLVVFARQLTIDLWQIDPRFHGDLSLHFPMALPNDVVASLRSPSLAFPVTAEYVFHMPGVRARP